MRGLYEYLGLTDNQRCELLWQEGQFITNVGGEKYSYCLYTIYGFYVEVTLTDNQISEVTPFQIGSRLDKYLDFIELPL